MQQPAIVAPSGSRDAEAGGLQRRAAAVVGFAASPDLFLETEFRVKVSRVVMRKEAVWGSQPQTVCEVIVSSEGREPWCGDFQNCKNASFCCSTIPQRLI